MARLEDKGTRGLPPPPAPTRRSANPWSLSDTARKREEKPPPASIQDLLDELHPESEAGQPQRAEPPEAVRHHHPAPQTERHGSGIWPLFILLIAVGVIIKVVSQAAETGNWRMAIAPIIAILFIAHGWWRMRQRKRQDADLKPDDER